VIRGGISIDLDAERNTTVLRSLIATLVFASTALLHSAVTDPPQRTVDAAVAAEIKAARKAVESLEVSARFSRSAGGKLNGEWTAFRPKRGNWIDTKKGVDIAKYKHDVSAVRVRYSFSGPAEIDLAIPAGGDLIFLGLKSAESYRTDHPPWRETLKVKENVRFSLVSDVHGNFTLNWDSGISEEARAASLEQVRAKLLERAATSSRMVFVIDGRWVAIAQLVDRDGKVALAVRSVEPIEEVDDLGAGAMQAIQDLAAQSRRYRELAQKGAPAEEFDVQPTKWTRTLVDSKEATVPHFTGCWHCSRRPEIPLASDYCPESCPGCEHNPGCEGNDPENCAACRKNIPARHVVTKAEQASYARLMEVFAAQAEGTMVVEKRITIRCSHREITLSRAVVERSWRFEWTLSITGAFPKAVRVMALSPADAPAIEARVTDGAVGAAVIQLMTTSLEQLRKSSSLMSAPVDDGGPTAPGFAREVQAEPLAALTQCTLLVKLEDGRLLRVVQGSKKGKIRLEVPTFQDWLAATLKEELRVHP
jgi:hypothetical protein